MPQLQRAPLRALIILLTAALLATTAAGLLARPAQAAGTPIQGRDQLSVEQLVTWYARSGKTPRLTVPIRDLARYFIEEGRAEGIRGDIAFAQSIVETAYFTFPSYGQVRPEHNNFAGLGAVDGGNNPNRFPSARIGVRAQIQHLRAYADPKVCGGPGNPRGCTASNLAYPLVSPRFHLVTPKGKAPTWEQLSGTWATDRGYGGKILTVYRAIAATKVPAATSTAPTPVLPEGMRVRRSDGAGFLISGGHARLVRDAAASTWGWPKSSFVTGFDTELGRMPRGALLLWRPGTLLRTPDGRTWLWDGSARRRVTSEVFRARGYDRRAVVGITATNESATRTGAALDARTWVDGEVVRFGLETRTFEVRRSATATRLLPIPGPAFARARYGSLPVVAQRPASTARPALGTPVSWRTGTLLQTPDGIRWYVEGGKRRQLRGTGKVVTALRGLTPVQVSAATAALLPVGSPLG